jgi:DNA repair exonuclease SbcCD ATPase subunit
LYYPKVEVSFTTKIDELQRDIEGLAYELSKWKNQAVLEFEIRRQAEEEVSQLKASSREALSDNAKLEQHIQEWKLIAEKYRSATVKFREGVRQTIAILGELNSEL